MSAGSTSSERVSWRPTTQLELRLYYRSEFSTYAGELDTLYPDGVPPQLLLATGELPRVPVVQDRSEYFGQRSLSAVRSDALGEGKSARWADLARLYVEQSSAGVLEDGTVPHTLLSAAPTRGCDASSLFRIRAVDMLCDDVGVDMVQDIDAEKRRDIAATQPTAKAHVVGTGVAGQVSKSSSTSTHRFCWSLTRPPHSA